jgi:ribonuclease Y
MAPPDGGGTVDWGSFFLGSASVLVLSLLLYQWRVVLHRRLAVDEAREQLQQQATVAAKEQLFRQREAFEASLATTKEQLQEIESRCRLREDALDRRLEAVEDRERDLHAKEAAVKVARAEIEALQAEVERTRGKQLRELERIAGMRREEAEHMLLDRIERDFQGEAEQVLARAEEALQGDLRRRARSALLTAMERMATAQAREALVSVVQLPSDEYKQHLVGREGRNARAFELETGVDLLIDDTPGVVVLSAFEPVRREIARRALGRLLGEGGIHPARIEEVVAETRQDMEDVIAQLGAEAADEAAVAGVHPRLLTLVGRLEFRTSEGRNVRQHAVETAHLAGALAGELGLDPALARRCGLLHSVGKAVDHPHEGSHAQVGADFARRCNEDEQVVAAIGTHADEAPRSVYAALVRVAATVCARRPGSGDDRVEHAIRRHEEVEALASQHAGVQRVYAVQAGRELRVIVDPAKVSEKAAARLAREVAKQLEAAPTGPGEVTVIVLRETRHAEVAG